MLGNIFTRHWGTFRTHVSFMMTFVDPNYDGFSTEPTYATETWSNSELV